MNKALDNNINMWYNINNYKEKPMKSYKLDMSDEEHRLLKTWAASSGKSIKNFLLEAAKEKATGEKLTKEEEKKTK